MADFDLKDFVETYIDVALEASKNGLNMNDFYESLFKLSNRI